MCDCTEYEYMIDGQRVVFPSAFSPVPKPGYHWFSLLKKHLKSVGLVPVALTNRRGTWYSCFSCEQLKPFQTKKWRS